MKADHIRALADAKDLFLLFLERRVATRADAEDLLQTALLKAIAHVDELRDDDRLVVWFYAVLRNQIAEHSRRRAARTRAAGKLGSTTVELEPDDDVFRAACACVGEIVHTLKPEYATVLKRVEVEGQAPRVVAAEIGVTPSNLTVRLYRARRALRERLRVTCRTCATHGCLDCHCRDGGHAGAPAAP